VLIFRVNDRRRQQLRTGLLGGGQGLMGLLLQSREELIVGHTLACYQGLDLAQPTICPS
jgi:hypothetical protein